MGTTVSVGRPGQLVVDRASRSQAKEECDKQYNEAMLGLQQHRLDQIEMEHIANPEVRSKIGYHTNFTEEVQAHNDLVRGSACSAHADAHGVYTPGVITGFRRRLLTC